MKRILTHIKCRTLVTDIKDVVYKVNYKILPVMDTNLKIIPYNDNSKLNIKINSDLLKFKLNTLKLEY